MNKSSCDYSKTFLYTEFVVLKDYYTNYYSCKFTNYIDFRKFLMHTVMAIENIVKFNL